MTSKFRATKREPSPLVGPAVSDSDTLPTLPPLKLRVTALFSFSFAPHRFRRLILLRTTNEHASSDKLDVVRSRLKRDKREQGVSGGGSVVRRGRTVEKTKRKKKKEEKEENTKKKKKIVRIVIIYQDVRPVYTIYAQEDEVAKQMGRRGGEEGRREPRNSSIEMR